MGSTSTLSDRPLKGRRRQSQWRAFDQAGGKADRPGVDLFLLRPKVERPRWNWLLSRRRKGVG
jgi:hypothetical protein